MFCTREVESGSLRCFASLSGTVLSHESCHCLLIQYRAAGSPGRCINNSFERNSLLEAFIQLCCTFKRATKCRSEFTAKPLVCLWPLAFITSTGLLISRPSNRMTTTTLHTKNKSPNCEASGLRTHSGRPPHQQSHGSLVAETHGQKMSDGVCMYATCWLLMCQHWCSKHAPPACDWWEENAFIHFRNYGL